MPCKFVWQCLAVAVLSCVVDIVAAVHIRALIVADVAGAVASIVLAHYLGYCGQAWFIDHPQTSRRLLLTTAAALGAGVGSALLLLVQ